MLLLSARSGQVAQRIGPRIPMTVGPLVCAAAMLLLSTVGPHADYWWQVLPAIIIFGLGLSALVAPLTATALGALDDAHAGIASGVNNAVARAAGLLSVAVLPLAAGIGSGQLTNPADLHPTYRNAMMICAGLMIGGSVVSAIFVPSRLPGHAPEPAPAGASGMGAPGKRAVPAAPAGAPTGRAAAQAGAAVPASAAGPQPISREPSPIRWFCDPCGTPVHPRS
jgi:MFS family permease